MPNIKSAKKRVLVIEKKRVENRSKLSEMRTVVKKFNNAIDVNDLKLAEALLPSVFSVIDKCASDNIIHKNNAANKKSAIAKRFSDVKSGKLKIVIKKDNKTIASEKAKKAQEARDLQRAEAKKAAEEKRIAKEKEALKKLTPAERAKLEKEKAKAEKKK